MKHTALFALTLAFALPVAGCKSLLKKRQPTESTSASATAAPPPVAVAPTPPPTPTPAPAAAVDAPTPEDFEDAAFEKITAQNFQAELTRLKKEIEQP